MPEKVPFPSDDCDENFQIDPADPDEEPDDDPEGSDPEDVDQGPGEGTDPDWEELTRRHMDEMEEDGGEGVPAYRPV